jgi:hypothetical protein
MRRWWCCKIGSRCGQPEPIFMVRRAATGSIRNARTTACKAVANAAIAIVFAGIASRR